MARPTSDHHRGGGGQSLKALLIIVVLVVIGAAVLSRTSGAPTTRTASATTHHTAAPATTTPTTAPAPTTTAPLIPASQVKVQVLNGVGSGAYAGQWTTRLKSTAGYITEAPDDATTTVSASAIYVLTPGYVAEAQALAAAVGLPSTAVNTTVPPPATAPIKATERSTANLVLVVGPDLTASA